MTSTEYDAAFLEEVEGEGEEIEETSLDLVKKDAEAFVERIAKMFADDGEETPTPGNVDFKTPMDELFDDEDESEPPIGEFWRVGK